MIGQADLERLLTELSQVEEKEDLFHALEWGRENNLDESVVNYLVQAGQNGIHELLNRALNEIADKEGGVRVIVSGQGGSEDPISVAGAVLFWSAFELGFECCKQYGHSDG